MKNDKKEKKEEKSFFSQKEEGILEYWKKNKIFQKSVGQRSEAKKFIFFEGPPTANGKPGIHHVLARSYKDIICRYKTMQGFKVERKAGWDTHGLPVELQVEKELKISSKPEIEKYGVEEFNKKCKDSVWHYKDEWERLTERMAYWLDLEHPYITYSNEYIESVWNILAEINRKGLLYEGHKVVPYCSRCGTGLSSHEVAQGYKKIKDTSVYVKFKAKAGQKRGDFTTDENTYFLVWTTTPWTLPGNVALAVGKDIEYYKIKVIESKNDKLKNSENYIFSKKYFDQLMAVAAGEPENGGLSERKYYLVTNDFNRTEIQIINEFKGKNLLDLEYEQLFDFIKPDKSAFRVVAGDFVTTQDGSGIVHIAPAFGVDDMNVAQENNLPVLITVNQEGKFIDKITPWAGKYVVREETNKEIRSELDKRGILSKTEPVEHDYPFCWRCNTKLIYYAKKSWFIKMSDEKIKAALIKNNSQINWIPEYIKEGRMGEWLREVKDWALSRERYWGTPLPVWKCQSGKLQITNYRRGAGFRMRNKLQTNPKSQISDCGEIKIIGSMAELERLSGKKLKDLHRPHIDKITFKCEKCKGEMVREKDVIDCWFDSGAMPFAQWHYPFENKSFIDKGEKFPADYISEAIDQTRGWFYTLLAISTLLEKGAPYKNVITYGHILDDKGQKMSKSKGNVVDPWFVAEKYGIDMLRWYFYTVGAPGEPKRFDFKEMDEIRNKFFRAYWNSFVFYETYKNIKKQKAKAEEPNILDAWIVLRLDEVIDLAAKYLENYDVMHAARLIAEFIDELSNKYIRFSRDRMRGGEAGAIDTLREVLVKLAKLTAPFVPFISEEIYRNTKKADAPESVHLADWPMPKKHEEKAIESNKDIVIDMQGVFAIIDLGRTARVSSKIPVRQALAAMEIQGLKFENKELEELIKKELNVKKIVFKDKITDKKEFVPATNNNITVALDTVLTEELREEGLVRELIRQIQDLRKNSKYTIKDLAEMYYNTDSVSVKKALEAHGEAIKQKTILSAINSVPKIEKENCDAYKDIKIDGVKVEIGLKKV